MDEVSRETVRLHLHRLVDRICDEAATINANDRRDITEGPPDDRGWATWMMELTGHLLIDYTLPEGGDGGLGAAPSPVPSEAAAGAPEPAADVAAAPAPSEAAAAAPAPSESQGGVPAGRAEHEVDR